MFRFIVTGSLFLTAIFSSPLGAEEMQKVRVAPEMIKITPEGMFLQGKLGGTYPIRSLTHEGRHLYTEVDSRFFEYFGLMWRCAECGYKNMWHNDHCQNCYALRDPPDDY